VVAISAPLVAPQDPNSISLDVLRGPSERHPFGTDIFGRDVASRVIYGARVSLGVSFAGVAVAAVAGLLVGLISGYFGGLIDMVLQRASDVIVAFPWLVLGIVVVAVYGSSVTILILLIGLIGTPTVNRVVRSVAIELNHKPYIEAARVLGASNLRILLVHMFPNLLPGLITITASMVGTMILFEAALGFLGLGLPPPTPSWGAMIGGDALHQMYAAPWIVFFPGFALATVVFAVNLFGDLVRDEFDPRLRGL
jgi:peptide/nickel transport system permease protein